MQKNTSISEKRLKEIIEFLTKEELEQLLEPTSEDVAETSIPLVRMKAERGDSKEEDVPKELWLHVNQKRRCYYVQAKHNYSAWVTKDRPDGPQFAVNILEMRIKRVVDGANYSHKRGNSSHIAKEDKITGYGNMCDRSDVKAIASHPGFGTWETKWLTIS